MTIKDILETYTVEQLRRLRTLIEKAMQSLENDEEAVEASLMFPHWDGSGIEYPAGFRV